MSGCKAFDKARQDQQGKRRKGSDFMKSFIKSIEQLLGRHGASSEPETIGDSVLMQAPPWMLSAAIHMLIFIVVALLPYKMATRAETAVLEAVDPSQYTETEIARFELDSSPLEPTQLTTDSL